MFGAILPICITTLLTIAILLLVYMVLKFRQRRIALIHSTVVELAARGLPIPQVLLDPPTKRRAVLWTPLSLIGLGIGVIVMSVVQNVTFWAVGMVPLAIGLAQMLALYLEHRFQSHNAAG
jgi:hypothetical protein